MPHQKSEEGWLHVTEVLDLAIHKHFLYYWAGKYGLAKCEQIKRESQELGTQVHELIEWQFKNPDTRLGRESNSHRMVSNFFDQFVAPYEVKPVSLEITLKDPKLKLQGTFDALINTNKGQRLADWKTSNSLDKFSVPLQLSAYAHLNRLAEKDAGFEESTKMGVVVRIDKKSDKVEIKWYENLDPYWPIFKAAMKVARFLKFGLEE
jgi:hypothetical protein